MDACRCLHSGWQDFGFSVRFNLVDTFDHVFVLTPLISAGTPSHDYSYQGEAVVGRQLSELRFGADASYRLDAVTRNLSVSGHYAYAIVEQVIDVSTNRSNAAVAVDYRAARNWSLGGFVAWQRTHGGLRAGSLPPSGLPVPGDINTPERIAEHDRVLRDNSTHVGAHTSYQLGRASLFGSFVFFTGGTDTHAGWGVVGGVTTPFRLGR